MMRMRFAAKRLQRIAQGFSPGYRFSKAIALKGRPIGACLVHVEPELVGGDSRGSVDALLAIPSAGLHLRSPFQVDSGADDFPGLKPWAVLLDHFMVRAGRVATTTRTISITGSFH
jgi:hypothetical protein